MKKYILYFILTFALFLSGCSQDKPTAGSKSPEGDTIVTADPSSGQITEKKPAISVEKDIGSDEAKTNNHESDFTYSIDDDSCMILGYTGKRDEVRIPEKIEGKPVKSIFAGAFQKNNTIKRVIIPDSVTMILGHTFYGCAALESVEIPDSVTYIGDFAFAFCTGLSNVTIPGSVKTIENSAFFKCTKLTSVTIGEGVNYIDLHAFRGCTGLTDLSIPDSLTIIEDHAFANCNLSDDDTIEKIKSINPKAFERYLFD
ncbi:MAG: leucine-rich repeat domain-containing protein [Clostridiaceae bacterium]|nr:leucine-rich repeat domain-containing protein [Clostridiaceae bacterium]